MTSIEEGVFDGCSSLTAITLPEGVTNIGDRAFYCCSSLTAITLPEGLTSIGEEAFYFCRSLTAITLPKGLTSIGNWAFDGCSIKTVINFSGFNLQSGDLYGGYVARNADRVINVDKIIDGYAFKTIDEVHYLTGYIDDDMELILPNGYQGENYQIGERAFYGCSSLTTITLPESVTSIGNNAFRGCSGLKELTLGEGLKKIASGTFSTCTDLEKITIHATQPPRIEGQGNSIFSDATYENATLYVPQGSAAKYQVMTGWSGFYNISEMEGGTPDYLTLRQADNGAIGIAVDLGRTYKVCITPSIGWKIHSVTFNGTDITSQLNDDNTLTTPTINGSSELVVAYEKDNTAISNAKESHIKVQGHRGTLRITGATQGAAISVYTTDGTLVTQESAEESDTEITLPTGQVYIVKVADTVVKIGM